MDKSIYDIYKTIELIKIEISLENFSIVKNQLDDLDFVVLKKNRLIKIYLMIVIKKFTLKITKV
jgi:hypothetical protein